MRILDWKGEHGDLGWWTRALGMAVFTGVILGVFGPFGSFLNGNALLRIFSWTVNLVAGTLIIGVLVPFFTQIGLKLRLSVPFALAVALLITTVPTTLFSAAFGYWLWPRAVDRVRPEEWFAQALMVEIVMLGLWILISLAREALTRPAPIDAKPVVVDLNAPVICLQMEDHYVRIHRPSGSTLELMPLQEAITRYGDDQGLKVHRSWWVSASAVDKAERDTRNWRLRLNNGLAVPVARNRVAEVRARGWIAADVD